MKRIEIIAKMDEMDVAKEIIEFLVKHKLYYSELDAVYGLAQYLREEVGGTKMKCQLCDGKGEYMHQCGGYRPCEYCNGTGELAEQKQTNFDQVTASPEALAKFIHKAEEKYERCCNDVDMRCDFCECQWCGVAGRSELVEWLKQEVK